MKRLLFAVASLVAISSVADDWREQMWEKPVALREGVTVRAYALDEPRPMKAYVARIDLSTPGIGFTATERAEGWGEKMEDVTQWVTGLRGQENAGG